MNEQTTLQQAVAAARAGRKAEARQLLQQILQANPGHEQAWLWLSAVVETDTERIKCLKRVLALNPDNALARKGLAKLQAGQSAPPVPPPPAPTPPAARCPHCGSDNPAGFRFCGQCGQQLGATAPPAPSPQPPAQKASPPAMGKVRPESTLIKQGLWLLVGGLILLVVCSLISWLAYQNLFSSGLPEGARQALDDKFQIHEPGLTYNVVSAQKGTPKASLLGGVPDEVWCVVTDRGINARSHFTLRRNGLLWVVGTLQDGEQKIFLFYGCSNW